jgi:hypothetical protein
VARQRLGQQGGLLGIATGSFGDSFDPISEEHFTRAACAELLIDAGAVVAPSVCEGILSSRARGLLHLFRRKDLLPRTLKFRVALGDLDAVRTALDENGNDLAMLNDAFIYACSFEHDSIASLLLERSIALDPELGAHVDGSVGRVAFIRYFIDKRPAHATLVGAWKAFVMEQITRAIQEHAGHKAQIPHGAGGDLDAFARGLQREPWLLSDAYVWFQTRLIETATLNDRQAFIVALLDLDPAILRRQPPPQSQAIEFALTYANTHLIPLLTRIWPLPDDLPHTAGMGTLTRVKQWFDESGAPALGDLNDHYPYNDPRARGHLQWSQPTLQQILDVALAFSVMNRHLDVADFLLEHGANINTNWSSHEPASILHELVFHANYESMQFLSAMAATRRSKTTVGRRLHRAGRATRRMNEQMAQWLEAQEPRRKQRPKGAPRLGSWAGARRTSSTAGAPAALHHPGTPPRNSRTLHRRSRDC